MTREISPKWEEHRESGEKVWLWQVGHATCIVLKGDRYSFNVEVRSRWEKADNLENLQDLLEPIVEQWNTCDDVGIEHIQKCIADVMFCMLNLPIDLQEDFDELQMRSKAWKY